MVAVSGPHSPCNATASMVDVGFHKPPDCQLSMSPHEDCPFRVIVQSTQMVSGDTFRVVPDCHAFD